jgi:hypothetical protein
VENFENLNFEFLRAFRRALAEANRGEIKITGAALCWLAPALSPCSLAPSRSTPAPSAPTQALEEGGEEEAAPPDPPLFFPATCTSPTVLPSPAPTHSTPRPRPTPPSMRVRPTRPVSPVHAASMSCAGRSLDALALDAPAYIKPLRSNGATHLTPLYLPDIVAKPRLP